MFQRMSSVICIAIASTMSLTIVAADAGSDVLDSTEYGQPNPGGPDMQQAQPDLFGGSWIMLLIFGFLFLMIFSSTRSQKKEQRRHQELVDNLKEGQRVVTAGGIHGTVVRRGEHTVDLKTGEEGETIITFGVNAINKHITEESED